MTITPAQHSTTLPATLTTGHALGLTLDSEGGSPAPSRAKPLGTADSFVTLWGPDGRAVATLTRPRLYGDAAANPDAPGLYRLNATDGRLVAAFHRNPTMAAIRDAICAYVRPVDPHAVESACDAQCRAEAAQAAESLAQNIAAAGQSSFDIFRASAITRAIRAARLVTTWESALCDGCHKCDGSGKAPSGDACPNCAPASEDSNAAVKALRPRRSLSAAANPDAPQRPSRSAAAARGCPSVLAARAMAHGPALAPQRRVTGSHGVTLSGMAPSTQSGGYPLWTMDAERRPAAALLRDIADAAQAAAEFH